jgi:hypothetical protein
MDYANLIARISALDFIENTSMADTAAKSVAGYLAGRLEELPATRLSEDQEEPSSEALINNQTYVTTVSGDELVRRVCDQFGLSIEDALTLISTIFHSAKEEVDAEAPIGTESYR